MQKSEEEIVKSLLSKGYNEEQIHDAIRYMRKQKQEEAARQTKENRRALQYLQLELLLNLNFF